MFLRRLRKYIGIHLLQGRLGYVCESHTYHHGTPNEVANGAGDYGLPEVRHGHIMTIEFGSEQEEHSSKAMFKVADHICRDWEPYRQYLATHSPTRLWW